MEIIYSEQYVLWSGHQKMCHMLEFTCETHDWMTLKI